MLLALAGKPVQSQVLLPRAGFAEKKIPQGQTSNNWRLCVLFTLSGVLSHPSSDLDTVFCLLNSKAKCTAGLGSSLLYTKSTCLEGRSDLGW